VRHGRVAYPEAPKIVKGFDLVDGKKLKNARGNFDGAGREGLGSADGIRADVDGICGWARMVGPGYDGVHILRRAASGLE